MATFKICVFEHQKRRDGKYPVSIRVCWKRKYGYITTGYYVTDKQARRKITKTPEGDKIVTLELKDNYLLLDLNSRIAEYEDAKVKKLGHNIELYSAQELAKYFSKSVLPGSDQSIDFIEFSRRHCEKLVQKGKKSTATPLRCVVNAIIDYTGGREKIPISEITSKFLEGFEEYLRTKRKLTRINQRGKAVTIERPGLSDIGIFDYMTSVKTLFNAAVREYNDEDKDEIRIMHYPFRRYKLKKVPEPAKRVLNVEQIRLILAQNDKKLEHFRAILARRVFLLSFYLAGMNLADLYDLPVEAYKEGRVSYYRKKTRDRRRDSAFISLKVFPEAADLINQLRDPSGERLLAFSNYYTTSEIFQANINKGLKSVAQACDIKENLTTYYARFSFATIARNNCNVSRDDIDLTLNHVDQGLKMADAYINKDWSRVDDVIQKVIHFLNTSPLPNNNHSGETPKSLTK